MVTTISSKAALRGLMALTVAGTFGLFSACGGSSSSGAGGGGGGGGTSNVQSIAVDGGPVAGQIYPDAAFTSVTVCIPSSSTCQTVSGILIDTGSVGLRLLASAIPSLSLPQLSGSGNTTYYNCVNFVDGSYLWGPVAQADIKMADETARGTSLQLIENPTGFTVPFGCSNGGVNEDTLAALGANGIVGVGPYAQDCGSYCTSQANADIYFTCGPSGPCNSSTITLAQQVTNPIVKFTTDNNGVILELQSVDGAGATDSGSMIFGIGTESNNSLGSVSIFPINTSGTYAGFFTTTFNSQTLNESFIDSGSNGYFFPDSAIPQCSQDPGFYCPANTLNLSAQNTGVNNAQSTVDFSVDNAETLFNNDGGDSAFSNLAGPNGSANCTGVGTCGFDWGLPFFFGRNVFTSIQGQSVPSGTPAAPWWAY